MRAGWGDERLIPFWSPHSFLLTISPTLSYNLADFVRWNSLFIFAANGSRHYHLTPSTVYPAFFSRFRSPSSPPSLVASTMKRVGVFMT